MNLPTLEEYKQRQFQNGFDEVAERQWGPHESAATHAHGFSVEALVVQGEMWLTCGNETQHLRSGDSFSMKSGVPHSERYGEHGATYWAARKHDR